MNRIQTAIFCVLLTGVTEAVVAGVNDLVISELLAINNGIVVDEDGNNSDFFEVYNDGATTVNMDGLFATDDPTNLTKWRFPAVQLAAGSSLVVWCSDEDRRDPTRPLHANFRLTGLGEPLILVDTNGSTMLFSYLPYPQQVEDVSYGLRQSGGGATPLVSSESACSVLIPDNDSLGFTWTESDFVEDASWINGTTPVGYDRNVTYIPIINTNVRTQMNAVNTTAYIRIPFTAPADIASQTSFNLRMKYDDGYICYINGMPVAGQNDPNLALEPDPSGAAATGEHQDALAVVFEEESFGGASAILNPGSDNVLAIHGLNRNLGSSDFLIEAELDVLSNGVLDRNTVEYFETPTPGTSNGVGFPGVSVKAALSPAGTTFTGNLLVSQTVVAPGATFRYTTDGTIPNDTSPIFPGGGLSLAGSTLIRIRTFDSPLAPSPVVSVGYMQLANDVANFTSSLPVILIDTFGTAIRSSNNTSLDVFRPAYMAVFQPIGGTTTIDGVTPPVIQSRVGIKVRGSSTDRSSFDKKSYRFEFWGEQGEDISFSPFGLPAESDWVLYGSHNWDRSAIRTPFSYNLSNQIGRYAAQTRPVEVFVNSRRENVRHNIVNDSDLGTMTMQDFFGYYTFTETVKRDVGRVNITRLSPAQNTEPEITGGWIFKFDRLGPGQSGFPIAVPQNGVFVEPDEFDLSATQRAWLPDHLASLVAAMQSPVSADPVLGYAPFIDEASWIDHNILGTLVMNVDALRLSSYYSKERGGPIKAGPIWDTDRSIDSTDRRDNNPQEWWDLDEPDTSRYFNWGWWDYLFEDPNFMQLWVDRWADLRKFEFTDASINALIDSLTAEIAQIIARNFSASPDQFHQPSGGWNNEIQKIRNWLGTRLTWIDSQFVTAPSMSRMSQEVTFPFSVTLTAPKGLIRLTRDGTDPRLHGGDMAPGVEVVSSGTTITVQSNARIVARAYDPTQPWTEHAVPTFWSAPEIVTLWDSIPPFVITEMMFHPADPLAPTLDADDFEFIEIQLIDSSPTSLAGLRLFGGIEFVFPDITLSPGAVVVVVSNLTAFETRYDTSGMNIAGEYTGRLSNGGDLVGLEGRFGEPIHEYTYSDLWYPTTDGAGDSLTIVDALSPLSTWGDAASWLPSPQLDGSPGSAPNPFDDVEGGQVPGDGNQDGDVDLSDAIWLLRRLFFGSGVALPCTDAALDQGGNLTVLDVNGDLGVNLADAVYTLNYLFSAGPAPALGTNCQTVTGCFAVCAP